MTDRKTHAGAQEYLTGYCGSRYTAKRKDQMLLRLAQAYGLLELVKLQKNQLVSKG